MQRLIRILNNKYFIHASLAVFTFSFFLINFGKVILSPNSFLATFSGDGVKSYFSYINHICNNTTFVETSGFNYPFGEHLVYTDAQPVLATIVGLLPFLKPYAIGVMHLVIFLSFVFVSNVYFKIFELYKVNRFLAFCFSIGIAILSPQVGRIGGHFALAYALPIPLSIYFALAYHKTNHQKYIYFSVILSLIFFFTHPYLGLGTTLFSLLFYLISKTFPLKQLNRKYFLNVIILLLPVLLFKFLMYVSDHHFQRPEIPYGEAVYVSSPELVFLAHFGPFRNLFKSVNDLTPETWEGLSYIGLASMLFLIIALLILIFRFSKVNKSALFLFVVATFLLLFSFGIINYGLNLLGMHPIALKQFRGLGRFAWYFYYSIPVFTVVVIEHFIKEQCNIKIKNLCVALLSLAYLSGNIYEGLHYHKNESAFIFNEKNYFARENLTTEHAQIIKTALSKNYQAILPLPYFHLGSEVYNRQSKEIASTAILLSFHTKLPILSHIGSRTSLYETEKSIGVLNSYRNKYELSKLMNNSSVLIIHQGEQLTSEEERLLRKAKYIHAVNNLKFYEIQSNELLKAETTPNKGAIDLTRDTVSSRIYKVSRSLAPFYQWHKCYDYNKLLILDSNRMESGDYVVSFYYHFKKFNLENTRAHFILESAQQGQPNNWDFYGDIHFSQRYPTFFVYEQKVKIQKNKNYVFFINHESSKGDYYVSNFCLRPDTQDFYEKRNGKIIRINNYPIGY